MRTTIPMVMVAALLGAGSHSVAAQEGLFQPRKDEALLGIHPLSQTVQGVPLSTPVFGFLTLLPEGDSLRLNTRVAVDLSDLQQKTGPLVDTIPLPTDNCARYSLDNIVMRIEGKQITIHGKVATLRLNGKAEVWTCLEVPFSSPFKNRNVRASFEVAIPFWLAVVDSHTVAVDLGDPKVQIKGDLGDLAEEVLKILGVDLNRQAKEALRRAINPNQLKASLPEDLRRLDPDILRAELLSNSGALAATLEMSTVVDGEGLGELLKLLQSGLPGAR